MSASVASTEGAQVLGLRLRQANDIIDRALGHARTMGLPPMTVTVLDCGGRMIASQREDGSSLLRPEIAHAKAFGALAMGMGSRALGERALTHPAFIAAVSTLAAGNLIPAAGGVLVRAADGRLLGAVGVSGALPDQDEACAEAAIVATGLIAQTGGGH